jgi:GT2 family glycosyltransferase
VPAFEGIPFTGSAEMTEPSTTEAVSGACMLVRRQLMQDMGGFDERYRLHCEDLDLMMRFHNAGYDVLFVPQAEAVHEQGVSSASRPRWVHREKHRSLRRFYDQHLASKSGWWGRTLMRLGIRLRYWALLPLQWLKR